MPVFVFVTAHGHFAIDAFKVGAVDFLLKPYDRERLGRALHAAAERIQALCAIEQQRRICAVIKETEAEVLPKVSAHKRRLPKQIVIRSHRRMHIVRGDQVDWIEATGRYCLLHCGLSIHRVEGPLADVTRRLGDSLFLRVGRSAIVNVDNVVELQDKAELVALLKNGDQVRVSERRRLNVLNQLCGTGAWGACDDWTGTVHLGQTTMEKRADSGTKFPKG